MPQRARVFVPGRLSPVVFFHFAVRIICPDASRSSRVSLCLEPRSPVSLLLLLPPSPLRRCIRLFSLLSQLVTSQSPVSVSLFRRQSISPTAPPRLSRIYPAYLRARHRGCPTPLRRLRHAGLFAPFSTDISFALRRSPSPASLYVKLC